MAINFYGLFVALGILAGSLIAEKLRKRENLLKISVFDCLPFILFFGIIGARIYHLLHFYSYYHRYPEEIFKIWQGGLGIFGGIGGGIVGLLLFLKLKIKKENLKFLEILLRCLDLGAVGLALGLAIGRWANFFNQELYGKPSRLPWAIYIKPEKRIFGLENYTHFHPLFFYESLGCGFIFLLLFKKFIKEKKSKPKSEDKKQKKTFRNGELFFLYLFLYGLLRFFLEFLRLEGWEWQGIRVNQIVSFSLILFSLLVLKLKSVKILFDKLKKL